MRRPFRWVAGLVLMAGIPIVLAPSAGAVPPTRASALFEGRVEIASCEGFTVVDQFFVTIDSTFFYDENGDLSEVHLLVRGEDNYVNTAPGETITMNASLMVHFDPATLLNMSAGLSYRLTVPGLGNVLLDVGHTIYDVGAGEFIVANGPHQVIEGDTSGVCLAFE